MPGRERSLRSLDRLDRICAAGGDSVALRLAVLDEFRRAVPFDAYAFLLTDPETWVGAAPLADVPAGVLAELPRLIRLKYVTAVNRWTALSPTPVALLQEATAPNLARSLLWREMLGSHDVHDVASLVFTDRFGCWGFLDLWRLGPAAQFSPAEAEFLSRAAPVVTTALRASQAATFTEEVRAAPAVGPVVLLLSPDLAVQTQTPQTQQYLRVLVPPSGGAPPIPASAYNVAAQLLAREAGVDANRASARVHLSDGLWVTLQAARIGDEVPLDQRDIAVTIEVTPPRTRAAVFARAHGLGARERELLDHLVTGCDTRELARRMLLSEHTVQDHLKSIFAKTATNTRGTLVSRAVGT
ncbi:MAG: hypothetical protein QOE19_1435 [Actinomycetota bacterium]|jgi:DNA-binding CsgD family transcriptional regulator|nr:hypothetical protein [Actinomycetota bacterium]